jgi:hypothetical protein
VTIRKAGLGFLAVALVLYAVVAASHAFLPRSADVDPTAEIAAPAPLKGWLNFDSGWYLSIASNGYSYTKGQQSSVAFFPAYPLTVRAVATTGVSEVVAGAALTLLSGLAVALLWWTWLRRRLEGRARMLAFALLLLYPYAWFLYGSLYADAFFLALVLGAFVALDHRRWVLAGVLGGIATAARPVAPAVIIGLLAVALDQSGVLRRERTDSAPRARWRFDRSKLRLSQVAVLLSAAGLLLWCGYLWRRFDDPLAFMTVQEAPGWAQPAGPRTWFKVLFFELVRDGAPFALRLIPQAVATLTCLALVPAVWKRFGWGYGVYTFVVVAIPAIGTGDFQGMGRYLLAAFPVFAFLGEWLAERAPTWMRQAAIPVSGLCLLVGAAMFGTGFYLT